MVSGLFIPLKLFCKENTETPYVFIFNQKDGRLELTLTSLDESQRKINESVFVLPKEHIKALVGCLSMAYKQLDGFDCPEGEDPTLSI